MVKKGSVKNIKDKLSVEFSTMFLHKAYILYVQNYEHLNVVLKPIERIPHVIRNSKTQESFVLVKPAFFLYGKPVYILLKTYPLSVEITFNQLNREIIYDIIQNSDLDKTIEKVNDTLKYENDIMDLDLNTKINDISKENLLDFFTMDEINEYIYTYEYDINKKILDDIGNIQYDEFDNIKYEKTGKRAKFKDDYTNGFIDYVKSKYVPEKEHQNQLVLTKTILEKRFIETGYNSYEMDSYLQSGYNSVLLRNKKVAIEIIAVWLMSLLCVFLLTVMFSSKNFFGVF